MAAGDYHQDGDSTYVEGVDGTFYEVFQDERGGHWYEDDDGEYQPLESPGEAATREWSMDALGQLNRLEHRLGRELTSSEADVVINDLAQAATDDAGESYLSYFDEDRTKDEDDRRDLMEEYMHDADAAQDAQGQVAEPEGFEDYEVVEE